MLIAVLVLALLLTGIGLWLSRDVFSPYVAVPGIWSIAILIYYLLPNTFYSVSNGFPFALSLWLCGFFIAAVLSERYTPAASKASQMRMPNMKILKAYVIITCLSVPIVCGVIVKMALTEDPENIFRYMRIMNTGLDENIEMPNLGILIYFLSLAYVMMFFSLLYFKSKKMKFIVIFMNILV